MRSGPRSLKVSDQHLTTGRVNALRVDRARLHELRTASVESTGCDLSDATFTGGTWSRVRFANGGLLSAQFGEATFEEETELVGDL